MKIIILITFMCVLAASSLAEAEWDHEYQENGQKQEMPGGPPGIKVETSAREQQKPGEYEMETVADEQGKPQMKIETSAKEQGPPGDAYAMQGKTRMTEAPPAEDEEETFQEEEEAFQEEDNEDLANVEQRGLRWPYGRYAMPKPRRGCPPGWRSGSRFSDNEDSGNINSESSGIATRLSVSIGRDTRIDYCVKNYAGFRSSGSWPRGRYCIARKGYSCPAGFTTGSVYWDDEDTHNINRRSGYLPDGVYGRDTKIYFCCRSDGSTRTSIRLPTTRPFVLYRYRSIFCQRVAGMSVRRDYIFTDDEDTLNINHCTGTHPAGSCGRNIRINFCYYY